MIRRAFWLAAGITIGVVAVRKVSQAKSTLGPEGLNRAVGQISDSISDFADALRSAMAERETDLRAALGVELPGATAPVAPETAAGAVPSSRRSLR
ncbi:MAG: hypothetical protein JWM61_408 [Micrococcaceae bacterium]|jgi:hypothetical protein|uniref:DUF6167 family protein n=1 Tax=Arthrobacter TaxID=1663 RepID=UPI001C7CDDAC|nr:MULTISPECIES: DUF6167 family protein [Arthrobacter]MCU1631756.1 hypothetical protein [Micrococcaceae bacterium]MEC5198369.1 hypothetical protein [Arthrobacter sp. PL16]